MIRNVTEMIDVDFIKHEIYGSIENLTGEI